MDEEKTGSVDLTSARESGRELITQAFEAAKRSGSPNWTEMTTAVLKNRLLDITDRAFRESDYGARSIADFIKIYPDMLALDFSAAPPKVRLIDGSRRKGTESPPAGRGRIRPDLWRSVMDYRSGEDYRWNGNQAVPARSPLSEEEEALPSLPTVSSEELSGWRHSFREEVREEMTLDGDESEQVDVWVREGLPTSKLPISVRRPWNEYLNKKVVDRLSAWFQEKALQAPGDMVQHQTPGRGPARVGVGQLREFVLRCVRSMTEEELRAVSLPPAAVLRAYGGGGQGLRDALGRAEER
ncbi:hypothetical protein ACLIYP_09395 [Streptomyces nanhaiensis]|uniref:hypothetical protein n=1 Tax=Streptomyces nanhaiensis TaxID=679319 RepID=UPI00399D3ACF